LDAELGEAQSAWLDGHIKSCPACATALARFTEIDTDLINWGQRVTRKNPPPGIARELLAAKLGSVSDRPWAIRWIAALAAVIAAALVMAVIATHNKPPEVSRERLPFVVIPYLPPLDPHENTTVVRLNLRVRTLLALGYRVSADPDNIVPADVLVGEDGRAHAVRVLSKSDSN
jgi:hypothetical protein